MVKHEKSIEEARVSGTGFAYVQFFNRLFKIKGKFHSPNTRHSLFIRHCHFQKMGTERKTGLLFV